MAIEHALVILSWYENRPPDEIPNENLWEDPKGLEAWWDRIKRRKEYSQGRTGSGGRDYDPAQVDEDIVENELVRQFKK
jgi:hypothetical protein